MKTTLTILKIGGQIIDQPKDLHDLLQKFTTIATPKILVHGGGKTATKLAQQMGVKTQLINGRRITTKSMLNIVTMVYGGSVNKNIVAQLQGLGCNALGLTGADMNMITAIKRPVKDIDYGWVGDITKVNTTALKALLNIGVTPVLAPLTHNGKGQLLNTNADTIASTIATALAQDYEVELIYCFEKAGVLLDINDANSLVKQLSKTTFIDYQQQSIIKDGMIPKLTNGFNALKNGVNTVNICSNQNFNSPILSGTELVIS